MNNEQLKNKWDSSKNDISINTQELLSDLKIELKKIDHAIQLRNRRETITAILLIPVFSIIAWFMPDSLSRIGALLIIPYCILVILVLRYVQKQKRSDITLPTKEFLQEHKAYLEKEKRLLDNVGWWYITPPVLSNIFIAIGLHKPLLFFTALVVGVAVYFINKNAVKKHFIPLLRYTEDNIQQLSPEK